ncbi:MAG: sigma-70 family RNA polymerase sigma factor [Actinomycetota bacterium]
MASFVSEMELTEAANDLDALFRAHYGRLVRALTLVAGSREAANDAVQEAFVKAHLHWRRVGRYEDPVGWIRRVAINKLRDDHRRQGRKERAIERVAAEQRTDTAHRVGVQWSDGADAAELLANLPRQQRLAVALFYVEGLSVAEVASTLDISDGAVKFHLHQGREKLRGIVSARRGASA